MLGHRVAGRPSPARRRPLRRPRPPVVPLVFPESGSCFAAFALLAVACLIPVLLAAPSPVAAADGPVLDRPVLDRPVVDGLQLAVGSYNVTGSSRAIEVHGALHLEPWDTLALFGQEVPVVPVFGALATVDGTAYVWYGVRLPFVVGERWTLVPQWGAGVYRQGDGLDLGALLEFRSALELTYRLDDGDELGLVFHHLSNAGLGRINPGQESLLVTWTTRLGGDS